MNPPGLLTTSRNLLLRALPYRWTAAWVVGALAIEMIFYAAIPLSFKWMIDRALLGPDADLLVWVVLGLACGVVLVLAVGLGRDYLYATMVSKILRDLRQQMFAHLQKLPMSYHTGDRTGGTLACFSGNLATIESTLASAIAMVVLPAMEATLSMVLLFCLEWRLACLSLLVFPLTTLGPGIFATRASRASYQRKQVEARAMALVQENLGAQAVVRGFNLEETACAAFDEQNQAVASKSVRVSFLGALIERSGTIGILTLQVMVLGVGALLVQRGMMTLGDLAAFQTLSGTLGYSLSYVTQSLPPLVLAGGALHEINDLLGQKTHVTDTHEAAELLRLSQQIVFDRVSFGYAPDKLNLENVSLTVRPGQSIALVGPSGSGKSTVVGLLLRFHDPSEGAIFFDDRDIRTATQGSLRRQLGSVFQESILFNTTIRENIRLGKLDATDAEIEEAARAAEIHDAIRSMPLGYDTPVGERGSRLSGGQRQRMAIARAIVSKPPILVLDEATSALDPGTESAINSTLAALGRGRTVVSVTHRLAAVTQMDVICVFNQGRLVEQGRHEELLERRGFYAGLWQKQAGFALEQDGLSSRLEASKLAQLPILQQLPPELQEAASHMFVSEHYPPGRVVVQEGDAADRFYLIVRGKVEVLAKRTTDNEQRLRILEDGDFFGEIALLFNVPRSASVRTLLPTLFMTLPRPQFLELLDRVPDLKTKIVETANQRYGGP